MFEIGGIFVSSKLYKRVSFYHITWYEIMLFGYCFYRGDMIETKILIF